MTETEAETETETETEAETEAETDRNSEKDGQTETETQGEGTWQLSGTRNTEPASFGVCSSAVEEDKRPFEIKGQRQNC